MNEEKTAFLQNHFIPLLQSIPSDRQPLWGKMTLQQMTEHFANSVRVASGLTEYQLIITPLENLQRMQDFLLSDKPFRENTHNPLMPEVPAPVKNVSIAKAIDELQTELKHFFAVFDANPHLTTRNPIFGDLNFEMNIQLLYKHALHHLRQFGVSPNP
jgi:hypothetical protein